MHQIFNNIKAVGFDLDQTLYPPTKKIDDILRQEIAKKILEKKPRLKTIKKVRDIYEKKYNEIGSWTRILDQLGVLNPKEVMYNCSTNVNILKFIKRDEKLIKIIKSINLRYYTFLITSSPEDFSILKLKKIGLEEDFFKYTIFGDSKGFTTKTDPSTFKKFLERSHYLPEEHVYIGDSLKADILPANSLGMKTIAVGNKISDADLSIRHIHDIEKLLL